MQYAELHCHSNFSFLDGVSDPAKLVEQAAQLGYCGLAITDHNGLYGAVRFADAARAFSLPTIYGAELTIHADTSLRLYQNVSHSICCGLSTAHVVVLATGVKGYFALCRVISRGNLRGKKGHPLLRLSDLEALSKECLILTGACPLSADPRYLLEIVDRSHLFIELTNNLMPEDCARNAFKRQIATRERLLTVATNNVHHALRKQGTYAQVATAIRAGTSLDDPMLRSLLHPTSERHLKSAEEMAELVDPLSVERAAEIGSSIAFDLCFAAPSLPRFDTPGGKSEAQYLRDLVFEGASKKYPPPGNERALRQLEYELSIIEELGYEGYFLIVWDIVRFCKESGILCQGRGSAANSAVCYALGITNADPIALDLLFERFLSPERDGPPDIDIDIEHERREEVIQYIYAKYGRSRAAQVANVICYRQRLALRDAGRAFGLTPGQLDSISRGVSGFLGSEARQALKKSGIDPRIARRVADTAEYLTGSPRHLGIHTGGMVLASKELWEVCPVEWASMPGRSVLQWDKDDCSAMGLVKFDLLGLGMLSCIHRCIDLVRQHHGVEIDLSKLPQEPEVYETISSADTVGVFQIESRAQMGALPRVRPRCFYDLVVQVALIRPGPIQGESVHPYIRRRRGEEPITYPHPLLRPALEKTLGVPIFQEQLMRIAMDAAGFSPSRADKLRQALSHKRSRERLAALKEELFEGMRANGIPDRVAEEIYSKLLGFADFGFPESHAASFAYLVYASAWLRYHYPAEYLAAILNSQPMGFYSPASLISDAKRHGVVVLEPDVCYSDFDCTLVDTMPSSSGGKPVLLGLRYVRNLGPRTIESILRARRQSQEGVRSSERSMGTNVSDHELPRSEASSLVREGFPNMKPFRDFYDFAERTGLDRKTLESLAMAGALRSLGISRREGIWKAGVAADGITTAKTKVRLPRIGSEIQLPEHIVEMSPFEKTVADLWATGVSPHSHLMEHYRSFLTEQGVWTVADVLASKNKSRAKVAGIITHKQRPSTARGTLFLNLEDETGMLNVIVDPRTLERHLETIVRARSALIEGVVEKYQGSVNLLAARIAELAFEAAPASRDFR
ncbi:MAG: error-prone DNA polymerase [Acidimicrobiia bacterium]